MTALQVNVDVGDPFAIYKQSEEMKYGLGTHPFLGRISEDRLVLTYFIGTESTHGTAKIPWPAYSDDGGRTWQFGDPFHWAEGPPEKESFGFAKGERFRGFTMGSFFSVLQDGDDRYMFSRRGFAQWRFRLTRLHSPDRGKTWNPPETSYVVFGDEFPEDPVKVTFESVAIKKGDEIFSVGYFTDTRVEKTRRNPHRFTTAVFSSSDMGYTWKYMTNVAASADVPRANTGPCEPSLIDLGDGEWLCVMRTGNKAGTAGISLNAGGDDMLSARTTDYGKTWELRRMNVPGVKPKLLKMSNGIMVLATGRPGNRLLFSLDEGRSWRKETLISPLNSMMSSGYCDIEEVEPGRLLAVYDIVNGTIDRFWFGGVERYSALVGRFIDVSRRFE